MPMCGLKWACQFNYSPFPPSAQDPAALQDVGPTKVESTTDLNVVDIEDVEFDEIHNPPPRSPEAKGEDGASKSLPPLSVHPPSVGNMQQDSVEKERSEVPSSQQAGPQSM